MQSTIGPAAHPRTDAVNASSAGVPGLGPELRRMVRGEVRFDAGSRALYSTDASNYRQIPIGVVVPRDREDVEAAIAVCRAWQVPVLPRGGGTSLAGQCCNAAVVLDLSKHMRRVLEVDPAARTARVEAGCVLDDLRHETEKHHLTFGPDPATHSHNTLGGMIGNDSCGAHSVLAEFYGPGARTAENVRELEVLTYDGLRLRVGPTSEAELVRIIGEGGRRGEIYGAMRALRDRYAYELRTRYPHIPRRVSGYNLPQLLPENGFNVARALVGSEGTCVTVLEATLELIESPRARTLLVLGYADVFVAGDHIPEIRSHRPIAIEGMDDLLVEDMKKRGIHPGDAELLPPGGGWLLVEFGGADKEESDARARALMEALKKAPGAPSMKLFDDPAAEQELWKVRESGLGATARVPGEPDNWPGWEDSAVPPDRVGDYLRALRKLFDAYEYEASLYGHFGQGCIHCRVSFDLTSAPGIAKFRAFMNDAADLVVRFGGSISGEHGDGQARAALLPRMFGEELVRAFREFKAIWDPEWKMNPGKVVDPYPITENLRLGDEYRFARPATHFRYPADDGVFARGVLRCVGVGECRRTEGGTMCPSYRVTLEEEHSTRGRARLLFEMLQGEVLKDGWRDPHVRKALDLCLACKGCRGDCPMTVDMATYKAEFLSHYYAGRLRPVSAYSMGLIYGWARLAAQLPDVANLLTQTPIFSGIAKRLAGVAPQRRMPRFAPRTFTQWFGERASRRGAGERVLLWPDTFNNHFYPEVGRAAVEVLEDAGFEVEIPRVSLCCGRPLYDFGMLDLAKRQLRQILDVLAPEIMAGVPVVGLEPSCAAVFRDELVSLFPDDGRAQRLSRQTYLLSEFLTRQGEHYRAPRLERRAVVHAHCHHRAVMGLKGETALLDAIGLEYDLLDSGCCGMAGSFGFERGHYDVSIACGERVLLPAVRASGADTLVITNGFSCREQIEQTTGRRAMHLAEVLRMALRARDGRKLVEPGTAAERAPVASWLVGAAALGGAAVLGAGAVQGVAQALHRSRRPQRDAADHERSLREHPFTQRPEA
jgi:FAD/FMN-containing dehydrogenase/Fe-S oxidoreductase